MITLRKLASFPPEQLLRKAVRLLTALERGDGEAVAAGPRYYARLAGLIEAAVTSAPFGAEPAADIVVPAARRVAELSADGEGCVRTTESRRALNDLRHGVGQLIGEPVAEWDLVLQPDRSGTTERYPMFVFLEDLRSPFNVGSAIRSGEALGASGVFLSPGTPGTEHPRTRRSAMGAEAAIPVERANVEEMFAAFDRVIALELGGTPVDEFVFPPRGVVIAGSEELGVRPETLRLADRSGGRVSVSLSGNKASLNVGVALGIVLHAWRRQLRTIS